MLLPGSPRIDMARCEACGEPIGESRLRAIPFAVRCRNCEEIQEATRRRIPGSEYLSRSLFRL